MCQSLDEARRDLRDRQGLGARYDSSDAPALDLSLARLGAAYFSRKLNELSDQQLDLPSRLPGWSRRHLVVESCYHARHLARLVEAARTGRSEEKLDDPEAQIEDVDLGASLPPNALRYLFHHSQIHLNVEWRDLDALGWQASIRSLRGAVIPVQDTPWMRAKAIWSAAVNLNSGGSRRDFPAELVARLDQI
ncbi:maleylpyruvate isomerase N-terminal domain-containing protein [Rhizobium sp. G187]|uniref:maleylpyruvate isomerase N-terminal domain-containing protein n=1 Tax=Rhizobium sp. G187 TaxID=3451352 RepID=UPI003EE68606